MTNKKKYSILADTLLSVGVGARANATTGMATRSKNLYGGIL